MSGTRQLRRELREIAIYARACQASLLPWERGRPRPPFLKRVARGDAKQERARSPPRNDLWRCPTGICTDGTIFLGPRTSCPLFLQLGTCCAEARARHVARPIARQSLQQCYAVYLQRVRIRHPLVNHPSLNLQARGTLSCFLRAGDWSGDLRAKKDWIKLRACRSFACCRVRRNRCAGRAGIVA